MKKTISLLLALALCATLLAGCSGPASSTASSAPAQSAASESQPQQAAPVSYTHLQHAGHGAGGGVVEKGEQQLADNKVYREIRKMCIRDRSRSSVWSLFGMRIETSGVCASV